MTDVQSAFAGPTVLTAFERRRIFSYLGALIVLMAFAAPSGGLIDLPLTFVLKNKLNLEAHALAQFRLIAGVPLYFSFVFGFLRDRWDPLGLGDRGYLLIFGAVSAVLYVASAFVPFTYTTLLIALLLLTSSFLFIASAQNGLATVLGQQHSMSGQISAAWNTFASLPTIAALWLGGAISNWLEGRHADQAVSILFLAGGALSFAIAAFATWRPREVFDSIRNERHPGARPWDDVRRLVRHRPVYPALLVWLLWNFAPGSSTPLQYYLQNRLHADDTQWGEWNAIFAASFIPTFLLFGVLCRHFAPKTLLWWGTIVAVPQLVPLLFIHSVTDALLAAVPIGLMGGVATAAYMDLLIRSAPHGLQGTMLMLSSSLYAVATRFGDVLGTILYDHYGGFTVCVAAITIVYALILPTLALVPPEITNSPDVATAG
jgi:MFS transporter